MGESRRKSQTQQSAFATGEHPIGNIEKSNGEQHSVPQDPDPPSLLGDEEPSAAVTGVADTGGGGNPGSRAGEHQGNRWRRDRGVTAATATATTAAGGQATKNKQNRKDKRGIFHRISPFASPRPWSALSAGHCLMPPIHYLILYDSFPGLGSPPREPPPAGW
ncbi:hypothetical protein DESUT3_27690 [Desulfuromonas versatilis]|uniref:Uncharacterized protein n=1 Tax=Desulfuromonas versatilis TaxID=2802975 RepID=A0ABM8HYA2_9BACT|nr:hypothetical protein DESUT3_27690 [Desulfuromonas versatilis]